MNVTDNYMLQQMQQMAASMNTLPQTGSAGKDKDGASFQDMMDQTAGSTQESKKDAPQQKPVQDGKETNESRQPQEKAPVQKKEEETLRPQDMTANPNAVQYLELFRPEIAETAAAAETGLELPVEAIPQAAVEEAAMDLQGEMPEMETAVDVDIQPEAPAQEQPAESFQQSLEEIPREQQAVEAEPAQEQAVETVQDAPAQAEGTDRARSEDAPEVESVQQQPQEEQADEPKEAPEATQSVFHEAKAAPVKVGESYETVDTQAPDMDEQMAKTIQQTLQSGGERVEIRLSPANLGALTIEMTRDAGGALQVVLHASSSRAAGLLNSHLDGLHAALQSYGPEPVHVEVQRNQESQQQHFQHADPDGRGNQQHQQHQEERRQEQTGGQDFLQKLRLGLFGTEETL